MVLVSLLPIGLAQTWVSVEHGLWYARSADFLQQPTFQTLRWLRIVGDTVFLSCASAFAWFVLGLFRPRPAIQPDALASSVAMSGAE